MRVGKGTKLRYAGHGYEGIYHSESRAQTPPFHPLGQSGAVYLIEKYDGDRDARLHRKAKPTSQDHALIRKSGSRTKAPQTTL